MSNGEHAAIRVSGWGELRGLPDVRAAIPSWHESAACRDYFTSETADYDPFFQESSIYHQRRNLGSGPALWAMLICSTCPVRQACLEAGFMVTRVEFNQYLDRGRPRASGRVNRSDGSDLLTHTEEKVTLGVWGGTMDSDRWPLRHLPMAERVEALESTLDERIAARIEAWSASKAKARPLKTPSKTFRLDRRIGELIRARRGATGTG